MKNALAVLSSTEAQTMSSQEMADYINAVRKLKSRSRWIEVCLQAVY